VDECKPLLPGRTRGHGDVAGRGSHSFTSELNLSAFCGIVGASRGYLGAIQELFRGCSGAVQGLFRGYSGAVCGVLGGFWGVLGGVQSVFLFQKRLKLS
jgi:hypothetical protein